MVRFHFLRALTLSLSLFMLLSISLTLTSTHSHSHKYTHALSLSLAHTLSLAHALAHTILYLSLLLLHPRHSHMNQGRERFEIKTLFKRPVCSFFSSHPSHTHTWSIWSIYLKFSWTQLHNSPISSAAAAGLVLGDSYLLFLKFFSVFMGVDDICSVPFWK